VEGGYTDLGSPSYNYSIGTTTGSLKSSSDAWYAAAKGTVPLNEQFSVYGKLGLARTHFSVNARISSAMPLSIGNTIATQPYKIGALTGTTTIWHLPPPIVTDHTHRHKKSVRCNQRQNKRRKNRSGSQNQP
jgi:hypothetical protein